MSTSHFLIPVVSSPALLESMHLVEAEMEQTFFKKSLFNSKKSNNKLKNIMVLNQISYGNYCIGCLQNQLIALLFSSG
jgi:hypothetical protein